MARRPIRDKIEEKADEIPRGPLGLAGKGDTLGAAGFVLRQVLVSPLELIPGMKTPGYTVTGHNTERLDRVERHTIFITALSEDVAEFTARYVSAPSNVDFVVEDYTVEKVETLTERPSYNTFKITVDIPLDETQWNTNAGE